MNDNVNLDKVRDEKCVPIARQIFSDLVTDLLPKDTNPIDLNPLAIKILGYGRDGDLNIASEVSYVFQLVLGVLTALNTTVQKATTTPIDEVRFFNIGSKILDIVSKANVKIGNVTPDETTADFAPILEQINTLFAEEKLTLIEIKYVMDNVFNLFTVVNNVVSGSIEKSSEMAEAHLFGVEAMSDLTLGRLDSILKDVAKAKEATVKVAETLKNAE